MADVQMIKENIVAVGKLLYDRGYVISNDGNISVRTEENEVWITPSGVSKGRMTPDMLVKTDLSGNVLEGDRYPSSEIKMHLMVYQNRPDVMSVVHAHPVYATSYAICRQPLTKRYMPEMLLALGDVPVADFAIPSTEEVPLSVKPFVKDKNAILLANHGVLVWGTDIWSAFDRMETVEYTAKMYQSVDRAGQGVEIDDKQAEQLYTLLDHYKKLTEKRG